eukprot:5436187-Prymnesium_polylepis.1
MRVLSSLLRNLDHSVSAVGTYRALSRLKYKAEAMFAFSLLKAFHSGRESGDEHALEQKLSISVPSGLPALMSLWPSCVAAASTATMTMLRGSRNCHARWRPVVRQSFSTERAVSSVK